MGKILNVPYLSQWDYTANDTINDCGPASIAMILSYYDKNFKKTVDDVFQETGAGFGYVNFPQMYRAISAYGYSYSYAAGVTKHQLIELINKNTPIIALVHYGNIPKRQDTGFYGPHFLNVVGYDENGVYLNDPNYWDSRKDEGKNKFVSWNEFIKAWENATIDGNPSRSMIVIYDKDDINLDTVIEEKQVISSHISNKASYFDRIINHEHKAGSLKTNRSEDYTDADITQLTDGLRADKKAVEKELSKANVQVGYLHRIYSGLKKLGIMHTDKSEDLNDKIVLEQVKFTIETMEKNQRKDEEVADQNIEELENENASLKETIKHHGSELETQRKSYENLISRNEERHKEEIKALEEKPEIVNAEKTLNELSELRQKAKQLDNPVMQFFLKVVTFFERQ